MELKLYLSVLIIVTISKQTVFCWREGYYNDNIVTSKEDHNQDSGAVQNSDASENLPILDHDRVIFPDEKYNYWKELHSTSKPKPQNMQSCVTSCKLSGDDEPVCGTDGVTYLNLDQLQCAIKCGIDVRLRSLSPCPDWNNPISSPSPKSKSIVLQSCLSMCPTTPEYNPVCGTDNVTYKNHGKLVCAQTCGIDVKIKRHSPCPKPLLSTLSPIETTTRQSPYELSIELRDCIHNCPATSEYNPVCGTNGVTYYNMGKLDCAKYCGLDVTLYSRSSCNNPITTTTSTTTTTTPTPITEVTIPQNILDEIFGTHEDDDNEEDIDIRNRPKHSSP